MNRGSVTIGIAWWMTPISRSGSVLHSEYSGQDHLFDLPEQGHGHGHDEQNQEPPGPLREPLHQERPRLRQADGRLRIRVQDQGVGFDTNQLKPHNAGTHGLLNTQSKLTLLGCSMRIDSSPNHGTEVIIEAPISQTED